MVQDLVRNRTIRSYSTRRAFEKVDRKLFSPPTEEAFVYADMPIRSDRHHLSAPGIYAEALEAMLPLREGQSFLNIGSGSGYLSSLVASMIGPTGTSHGIELHKEMIDFARQKCASIGFGHIEFFHGNAYDVNYEGSMRYDRIYVGACASARSKHLYELLEIGGVMVAPFQTAQRVQQLRRVTRRSETEWYVEILKLVQFARLQEGDEPAPFCMPEPVWSPKAHGLYPRALRSTLEAIGHGKSRLPKEIWVYHIFPWIPKKWFVPTTSTLSTTLSPVKIETYDDGHRVRLGSAEDGDIDTPLWEGMIPPNPHGHFGANNEEEDSDGSDESIEEEMDVPVDLGLPPMPVLAEGQPVVVPALVRRVDVEVHNI
jgi:protein-L-isoaspartate(D-aspartate) O-methyltransferase